MEQTSSMAYPNVLALRYLRETGQVAPEIEMKATQFVNAGYQRLLTFESPSGGFNWWGDSEPGNMLLTGFGIQQFEDMSRVHEVDRGIIDRSRKWLASKQSSDGGWEPISQLHGYNEALGAGKLRTTAYILWSLLQVEDRGGHIDKAAKYLVDHLKEAEGDLYTLALVANALVLWDVKAAATKDLLAQIHDKREEGEGTVHWSTAGKTAMYARGQSATVETTALVTIALYTAKAYTTDLNGGLAYLVKAKGAQGDWGSTQATILSLKALLMGLGGVGDDADMSVDVLLDGKKVANETFNPDNADVLRLVDLGLVRPGAHKVELRAAGPANVMYQVAARYYLPWQQRPAAESPLELKVEYDRAQLRVEDILTAKVALRYLRAEPTFMVIIDLGIPPGFSVMSEDLETLRQQGRITKFDVTGRQVTLYVGEMSQEKPLSFSYKLRAKFPVRAKTPRSVAYEYYTPDARGVQEPQLLTVVGR